MTTLISGLNTTFRACMASCQGGLYYTNNYDPVLVWYGVSAAMQEAGISGPPLVIGAPTTGAGGFSNGDHQIRYRFQNSSNGFVSNPSPALVVSVAAGNGILTFSVGVAQDIVPSTDPKVDTILIEATPVGGGTFYQAGTCANTATSVAVGMNDAALTQQFNSDAEYGSAEELETYSSDVPPQCAFVVPYRGRMWYIGDQPYPLTNVTFTNGTTAVTGTGFSDLWVGKTITRSGDNFSYEIAAVGGPTALTLSVNYQGVTGSGSATVVSRFPNRGYYSRLYYPEQLLLSRWARDFLAESSDTIQAVVPRKDGLYVLGRYSGERLIFNADPSAAAGAVFSPLKGRRGCFNQRCVCDVEGDVYAVDRQGLWLVGEKPIHMSRHVDRLLERYVDYDESVQFHLNFEPVNRVLKYFFVPAGGDTPTMRACMELDTGKWWFESSLQGITASSIVATDDGQVRLMLGDENGFSWYDGVENAFDGTPPSSPTVVTVGAGATTTVIPVDETLPTVAPTVAGVMCYDPETGDAQHIASNTANEITLGAAYVTPPTENQSLYLGPISFMYQTKWFVGEDQAVRKDATFLIIKLFPGSDAGTMRVYFYADFGTVPSPITRWVGGTNPIGIIPPTSGQRYLEVQLSGGSDHRGVLAVPVPIEWNDALQARVVSIVPEGDLRVLDIQFLVRAGASDAG